jgi:hypothetical protein
MLGGLHIEMATLRVIGKFLEGSGRGHMLVHTNITTEGKAESFLKAAHVKRSRYAHMVTAACLFSLQKKAYFGSPEHDQVTFEKWKTSMKESHPQFHYWDIVLNLQLC